MYLTDYQETMLWSGTVFRFPAKHPFESTVDFMLVDYPDTESRFAIYCVSGYHAGQLERLLPQEARGPAGTLSISARWMAENWTKWIYTGCLASEVEVIL
ncbi:MAG: Imm45 family immunity protein [[Eubacterium] siraeum]|uniref:Imm45 family immunity protein n=1 Tax=Ruminococcus bicirculans (ex Wegman et al. 2014) TaxID=1160721 RepID=UPI00399B2A29